MHNQNGNASYQSLYLKTMIHANWEEKNNIIELKLVNKCNIMSITTLMVILCIFYYHTDACVNFKLKTKKKTPHTMQQLIAHLDKETENDITNDADEVWIDTNSNEITVEVGYQING